MAQEVQVLVLGYCAGVNGRSGPRPAGGRSRLRRRQVSMLTVPNAAGRRRVPTFGKLGGSPTEKQTPGAAGGGLHQALPNLECR
jgi:hypothetical protein